MNSTVSPRPCLALVALVLTLGACSSAGGSSAALPPADPPVVVGQSPAEEAPSTVPSPDPEAPADLSPATPPSGACPSPESGVVTQLEEDLGAAKGDLSAADTQCYQGWATSAYDPERTQTSSGQIVMRFDPAAGKWSQVAIGSTPTPCDYLRMPAEVAAHFDYCSQ